MGSHNQLTDTYNAKETKQNLIADPGNGGTIHTIIDDGVCLLTLTSAGQTRAFDPAANLPVGLRVTVVADQISGGGTCTLEGVAFSTEGQKAVFEVIRSNDTNSWSTAGIAGGGALSADTISEFTSAAGVEVSGVLLKDGRVSHADLELNSTNRLEVLFDGNAVLAVDDAAITGFATAEFEPPRHTFLATVSGSTGGQLGGDEGTHGGNFTLTAGAGGASTQPDPPNDGGDSGCISFVTQAGGATNDQSPGADGVIRLISAPGAVFFKQVAPTAHSTTGPTLAAAELLGGEITSTQTSAVTATLDTGSAMDAAIHSRVGANEAFDWTLINLGSSSGAVTVTPSSGHTVVGNAVVAVGTSGLFRTRKTAANTFVTSRRS